MSEVLLDGLAFPECPRWRDDHLWFSEKRGFRVSRLDVTGAAEVVLETEDEPGGIGWLPDGRMLLVSQIRRRVLRVDPDGLHVVAELAEHTTGKCNDMVVDAAGRAYVGHLTPTRDDGTREPASLLMVTPDGDVSVAVADLNGPNGGEFTDGGRTLLLAESGASRVLAFTVAGDGALTERRTWADLPVGPDGICVDREGAVWVAAPLAQEVLRVEEGGAVTDRITVGDRAPFACALGGPDGRTLYVCSDDLAAAFQPEPTGRGRIEAVRVEVPGAEA